MSKYSHYACGIIKQLNNIRILNQNTYINRPDLEIDIRKQIVPDQVIHIKELSPSTNKQMLSIVEKDFSLKDLTNTTSSQKKDTAPGAD